MFVTPAQLVQALGHWHLQSQQVARRNALVASTALAERRRELDEVERFLASRAAATAPAGRQDPPGAPGSVNPGA